MAQTRTVDTAVLNQPETATLRLVGRTGGAGFLSREQVLDAAEACFEAGGYDGVTIRAIAKQLGCSVGAIYRYFDDKRAMLIALGDRLLGEAVNAESLAQSTERWLAVATQRPDLYRLLFLLSSPQRPGIVGQLIDHWSAAVGSPQRAERRFALMHGLLMLGRAPDSVAEALDPTRAAPAKRPPAPVIAEPVAVEPTVASSRDDVTLL